MALKVGDKAPDFRLFDADKKERSLSEFLSKKTVLAFYPGAFTGVCTKELCTFRDSLSNLGKVNAQVVGISVDGPFANKSFATANNLSFPLLCDYTRAVSKQYCGVHEDFAGVKGYSAAKRSVFVLDMKGTVRYVWISENPGVEPPYDDINKAVASF
jgi:peroxiredoxin